MARATPALVTFNRGVISDKALARTDVERIASSASIQSNWMPSELGPMQFRAGTEYVGVPETETQEAIYVPFVFANDDTAIIELSGAEGSATMRVRVDEDIITRGILTSVIADEDMTTVGVGNWLDDSDVGCTAAAYLYGVGSPTGIYLSGTRDAAARIYQAVTTTTTGAQHAVQVVVDKNWDTVTMFIGSALGSQAYLEKTVLKPGVHSITFTPTASPYYIHFERQGYGRGIVRYCQIENGASGTPMSLDLSSLRVDFTMNQRSFRHVQSGDIVFCTNIGAYVKDDIAFTGAGLSFDGEGPVDKLVLFQIERRDNDSWSFVRYSPDNGPFNIVNTSGVTLTANTTNGDIVTITASQPIFRIGHLNSLVRIDSVGQQVTASLSAANTFTNPIRVTGVGNSRKITYTTTGTWSGTLTLERSVGVTGNWETVDDTTVNVSETYDDQLDNAVIFYRIGFQTAEYTSGTANITLSYATGSIAGTCRVFSVALDGLSIGGTVIEPMGNVLASESWYISQWHYEEGFPSANEIYDSRMWWCGRDRYWASVTDNFYSYEYLVEGDSGPINRAIGYGPIDRLRWMKGSQRLYMGGQTMEHVIKASSFDEPVTPSSNSIRRASTIGSCDADAVMLDGAIIFAQRGGSRMYELDISENAASTDATDLTLLCPEVLAGKVKQIVVQRTPETRVHAVLEDGTVAVLVYNRLEDVRGWIPVELNSTRKVVSALVVPSDSERDVLYYQVRVEQPGAYNNGYHELLRVVGDDECIGGTLNKNMDSLTHYDGDALGTISNPLTSIATHLASGTTVAVWADGEAKDDIVLGVSGLPCATLVPCTNVVFGLPYEGRYKSVKLAYAARETAILNKKKVTQVGMMALNTHKTGVKFGPDFTDMSDMPALDVTQDASTPPEVYETYDQVAFPFEGTWDTDSRICLYARSPKPATIQAITFTIQTNEKE